MQCKKQYLVAEKRRWTDRQCSSSLVFSRLVFYLILPRIEHLLKNYFSVCGHCECIITLWGCLHPYLIINSEIKKQFSQLIFDMEVLNLRSTREVLFSAYRGGGEGDQALSKARSKSPRNHHLSWTWACLLCPPRHYCNISETTLVCLTRLFLIWSKSQNCWNHPTPTEINESLRNQEDLSTWTTLKLWPQFHNFAQSQGGSLCKCFIIRWHI